MTVVWRQGGKVPHHVYRQRGDDPDRRPYPDGDPPIAMFLTPEDAELACRAVNALGVEDVIYDEFAPYLAEHLNDPEFRTAYEVASQQHDSEAGDPQ